MKNFEFYNPTRIVFGKNEVRRIGEFAKHYGKRALVIYGRGSIKRIGVYNIVIDSLKNNDIEIIEHNGVKPNPILSHVIEGVKLAKENSVDMIIAVGGGSVIDESKTIASGAKVDHNVWDFFINKAEIKDALPIIVVLTLAATASEMNSAAVITNEETRQKFNIRSECLYPKVSILDPTTTFSVPKNYTAYSAVDAITHLLEGYFTSEEKETPVTDRYVESFVKNIMESTERIIKKLDDYEARASMMWTATLAFNGIGTTGIGKFGFPNHMIEHSLSAIYDIPHGAGLSIVFPAWMIYQIENNNNVKKFAQFARRVFHILDKGNDKHIALSGVNKLKEWFKKIGSPVSLEEGNIPIQDIKIISQNAVMLAKKWLLNNYTEEIIADILRLAK